MKMNFNNYLLGKGFSNKSIETYQKDVNSFLEWLEQENITAETTVYSDILHYIQQLKAKVSQRTVAIKLNSIKHYFDYLMEKQSIIENPAHPIQIKGIKRKILYDILSKKELESIYNNYEVDEKLPTSLRNKVILGLLIYQGLNSQELGLLNEKDIKLREGKIFIPGTRRSNSRIMTLESHQMLDIMQYQLKTRQEILKQANKESERLIVSVGTSKSINGILQRLTKELKQKSGKVSNLKQIRTSVITHWLKIHNLRQVQHMAGHRFVSSTESYLINDLEDLQEDINKFHPI